MTDMHRVFIASLTGTNDDLTEIIQRYDIHIFDEIDDNPERNPRTGYIQAEDTSLPAALLAWRDAAVTEVLAQLPAQDDHDAETHLVGQTLATVETLAAVANELGHCFSGRITELARRAKPCPCGCTGGPDDCECGGACRCGSDCPTCDPLAYAAVSETDRTRPVNVNAVLGATDDGRLRIHCPACDWDAVYPCLDLTTVTDVVREHCHGHVAAETAVSETGAGA